MPEIANVFQRARISFHQITGRLHHDAECWNEVDAWIDAARVANIMFHNRLGLMGHYYNGMLDIAQRRDAASAPPSAGTSRSSRSTNCRACAMK